MPKAAATTSGPPKSDPSWPTTSQRPPCLSDLSAEGLPPHGGGAVGASSERQHLQYEKKILLWAPPTCVHLLPAHGERGPGLDEVIDDGAAVVSAAAPGQLGGAICHLLHRHRVWGAGRAWHNRRDRRLCEGLTHAETQTGLEHSHVTVPARKCCKKRENLANPPKYLLNNGAARDCSARFGSLYSLNLMSAKGKHLLKIFEF